MDNRVGYLVKRVQQLLRNRIDELLKPIGLTTAQYAALSALEDAPNLSNAALARACFVTPQTMIEILQGLLKAGLIERHTHPEHGRILQTELTALGRAKLSSAHAVVNSVEVTMLADIEATEQVQLAGLLTRCCENLERAG
jgi:DNA-binding MarR family transcriptional regulator